MGACDAGDLPGDTGGGEEGQRGGGAVAGVIHELRRAGGALPLPSNSGIPELGIPDYRSRINPTSIGRGLGRGVTVFRWITPSPGCFAADLSRKGRGEERGRREFTPSHHSPLTQ